MNTRHLMKQLAAIGLVAAAGGLASSALAAQEAVPAARTIRVLSAPKADAALPDAEVWKKAPAAQVSLQPAFPGHVSIVGTPVTQRLTAQAVRTADRLFVKLAWSDRTVDKTVDDTGQFVDAVAVEFPVNGNAATLAFMGDPNNAVNLWYWRANGRTENLLANGFGTATSVPSEGLRSAAVRTDSGWEVVISRTLRVGQEEGVVLSGRKTIPIAFAAWDGNDQERDGLKAVTLEWWQLRF